MSKLIDLIGQRFGNLIIIAYTGYKAGQSIWTCKCDCGNTIEVTRQELVRNRQFCCKKCKENLSKTKKRDPKILSTWYKIRSRCYSYNHSDYKYYGMKGITVCDEWVSDFDAFQNWCLENGYADNLVLIRCNKSEGFNPENCQWVPKEEQFKVKHNSPRLTDGTLLRSYCEEHELNYNIIVSRIYRGCTIEQAIDYGKGKRVKTTESDSTASLSDLAQNIIYPKNPGLPSSFKSTSSIDKKNDIKNDSPKKRKRKMKLQPVFSDEIENAAKAIWDIFNR